MNKRQYLAAIRLIETAEQGLPLKRFSSTTIDNALKLFAIASTPVYPNAGNRITVELLRRIGVKTSQQAVNLLNAKRQLTARMITAENDYEAISDEFWACQKRQWMLEAPEHTSRYQQHLSGANVRAWYAREWARSDCKGLA